MKKAVVFIIFLFALMTGACGWDYTPSDSQSFDYDLIGEWKSIYSGFGTLVIDYSWITINGYNGYSYHPLSNFTPGARLKGYSVIGDTINNKSKQGVIYIEDRGVMQEGVPYISYWEYGSNNKQYYLRFQLDGYEDDILIKVNDVY